ncbi:MAG: hypothetical protein IPK16_25960 [Anaerolineales bacterium]|nr:hypothetical protein [Anaerolineales bacterium]
MDDSVSVPVVAPGQPFVKTWRIMNSGTCPWTNQYGLFYVGGNDPASQMGGVPVPVQGTVAPGAVYDLSARLMAPQQQGIYRAFWQMLDSKGQPFGQKLWVTVQVQGAPGPTPIPPTPIPSISFTANRTTINAGDCVLFKWSVQNVNAVYFYRNGEDYRNHGVGGVDQRTVCPGSTSTYFLRVERRDGKVETPSITITVNQPQPNKPYVQSFTSDSYVLSPGQCTTLRWTVTGQVSPGGVTLDRNGKTIFNSAPVQGAMQQCLDQPGDYVFHITAVGPGGKGEGYSYVTVQSTPGPTPTPTPFIPAPVPAVIDYITANPDTIYLPDNCVYVSWSVGGGVTYTEIQIDGQTVSAGVDPVSGNTYCPDVAPDTTVVFTVYAQGMAGTPDQSKSVSVPVRGMAPDPTPEPTWVPEPTSEPEPTWVPEPTPEPTWAPQPPSIDSFSVYPDTINAGDSVTIGWSVSNADSITLMRNYDYWQGVGADGSVQDNPSDYTTYQLHACIGDACVDSDVLGVSVQQPEPEPTWAPEPDPTWEPDPDPDPDNPGGDVWPTEDPWATEEPSDNLGG